MKVRPVYNCIIQYQSMKGFSTTNPQNFCLLHEMWHEYAWYVHSTLKQYMLTWTSHSCISWVATVTLVEMITRLQEEFTPSTVDIVIVNWPSTLTKVGIWECHSTYIHVYQYLDFNLVPTLCMPMQLVMHFMVQNVWTILLKKVHNLGVDVRYANNA